MDHTFMEGKNEMRIQQQSFDSMSSKDKHHVSGIAIFCDPH